MKPQIRKPPIRQIGTCFPVVVGIGKLYAHLKIEDPKSDRALLDGKEADRLAGWLKNFAKWYRKKEKERRR